MLVVLVLHRYYRRAMMAMRTIYDCDEMLLLLQVD